MSRVFALLIPRCGQPVKIGMAASDYKALDAWYRDPDSADVPVRITDHHDREHTFYPRDLAEVAQARPAPEIGRG